MHAIVEPTLKERARGAAYGALAGVIAANLMTVFRALAQRAGVIEKTVPQAMEERVADALPVEDAGAPLLHHLADQAMHLGYAGLLGAMNGFLFGTPGTVSLARGFGVGAGTWAVGAGVMMPALRAGPPPWRASAGENAVNLAAHLLFGAGLDLVAVQLRSQTGHGPAGAQTARVG